jgi:serine/threonine protein kinase
MAEPPTPPDEDRTIVRPAAAGRGAREGALGHMLPVGTRLREYEITGLIGEGGFGIVYLAEDVALQRRVAVKEYMPSSMASRVAGSETIIVKSERHRETFAAGLKSFVNEARLLARFDHPALVKVYRFWEENGTAYMAMPFYEGPTLKSALAARTEPPDEATLRGLLRPLLDALAVMHSAQCYHRDIAPDNILLTATGPLLLDFGAARRVIGDMTHALTVVLKPGYAPIEQYGDVATMTQGAWTDLYALACVLYFAISGKVPMSSVERLMDDRLEPLATIAAGRYSERFLKAIDAALAVRPQDRPQTDAAFRALLDEPAAAPPSTFAIPLLDDVPTRVVPRGPHTAAVGPTQRPPVTGGPPVPPLRTPPITQGPPVPPLRPPAAPPGVAPDPDMTVVATSRMQGAQPPVARTGATDLQSRTAGLPASSGALDSLPGALEAPPRRTAYHEPVALSPSSSVHDAGLASRPDASRTIEAASPSAAVASRPMSLAASSAAAAPATRAVHTSRAPLLIAGAVALLLAIVMLAMQLWPGHEGEAGRAPEASRQPSSTDVSGKNAPGPTAAAPATLPPITSSPPSPSGTPGTGMPDRASTAPAPSVPPPQTTTPTTTASPISPRPDTPAQTPAQSPATNAKLSAPTPSVDAYRREDAMPPSDAKEHRARQDATHAEPPVVKPARTPNLDARCSDILQKASLEPLTAEEASFLRRECR